MTGPSQKSPRHIALVSSFEQQKRQAPNHSKSPTSHSLAPPPRHTNTHTHTLRETHLNASTRRLGRALVAGSPAPGCGSAAPHAPQRRPTSPRAIRPRGEDSFLWGSGFVRKNGGSRKSTNCWKCLKMDFCWKKEESLTMMDFCKNQESRGW